MKLIDDLFKKKRELARNISNSRAMLKRAPGEQLSVYVIDGNYYWHYTDKKTHKRVHIPKKDRDKAEKMALKTFNRYKAKHDVDLYEAICAFEEIYDSKRLSPEEYLQANPGLAQLVVPQIITDIGGWHAWANEDYPANDIFQENLSRKTLKGHYTRSKSEMTISDLLFSNGIPYRYEWGNYFNGYWLVPDFTIPDFERMQKNQYHEDSFKIWEHAGMVDDPEYMTDLARKISIYISAGYRLGENLIITTEDGQHPLDSSYVQGIIDKYLK